MYCGLGRCKRANGSAWFCFLSDMSDNCNLARSSSFSRLSFSSFDRFGLLQKSGNRVARANPAARVPGWETVGKVEGWTGKWKRIYRRFF